MALGLLEGGVDLLIVETVYDLLSGKAASPPVTGPWRDTVVSCRFRPRSRSN